MVLLMQILLINHLVTGEAETVSNLLFAQTDVELYQLMKYCVHLKSE